MAREKFVLGSSENFNEWVDTRKSNAKHEKRLTIINDCERKIALDGKLSYRDECALVKCITPTNGTGKVEYIPGCPDTNCLGNEFCNLRVKNCVRLSDADPDDPMDGMPICVFCYSARNENAYDALCHTTCDNMYILTHFDISEDAWSTLAIDAPLDIVRGEMHGDTMNMCQVHNNIKIVKSHKQYDFTFWGKNLGHWRSGFNEMTKPDNMMFVASSTYINRRRVIPADCAWFVDRVFTVYTKKYAQEHNIVINCGSYEGTKMIDHKCRKCMRCYNPLLKDFFINELVK